METGDEQSIMLIAASIEAAVAQIKHSFGPPYVVAWEDTVETVHSREIAPWNIDWTVVGNFEEVPGYSTKHRAEFTITRWAVLT